MVPKVSVAHKYPLPLDTEGYSDVPEDVMSCWEGNVNHRGRHEWSGLSTKCEGRKYLVSLKEQS